MRLSFLKEKRLIVLSVHHDVRLSLCLGEASLTVCFSAQARIARSARALKIGKLRPGIVLYDEPHPLGDDIGCIETADLTRKPDLLIIMGTSLKVHGLKKLVKEFAKAVHASGAKGRPSMIPKGKVIFVNKTTPSSEWDGIIDYHVEGETDVWVERVLEDWKKARPADWEVQTTLDGDAVEQVGAFRAQKATAHAMSQSKGMK
jgi:NAD-dependent histone deacetylase SIR2